MPGFKFIMILAFSIVHMGTAYLVHKKHKDEAQDQRNADAGMELLVSVFMCPTGSKNYFSFTLLL